MAKRAAGGSGSARGIALQAAALDIWAQKYCLRDRDGKPLDADVDGTWQRIARELKGSEWNGTELSPSH